MYKKSMGCKKGNKLNSNYQLPKKPNRLKNGNILLYCIYSQALFILFILRFLFFHYGI